MIGTKILPYAHTGCQRHLGIRKSGELVSLFWDFWEGFKNKQAPPCVTTFCVTTLFSFVKNPEWGHVLLCKKYMDGYNSKIIKKVVFSGKLNYQNFWWLYPSTKMAITPMFLEQIEKFQCLILSTTQGPDHSTPRRHVAHVTCPETCLKVF